MCYHSKHNQLNLIHNFKHFYISFLIGNIIKGSNFYYLFEVTIT